MNKPLTLKEAIKTSIDDMPVKIWTAEAATPRFTIKELFHKCWGGAHDSPDYNKAHWGKLQSALKDAGIDV